MKLNIIRMMLLEWVENLRIMKIYVVKFNESWDKEIEKKFCKIFVVCSLYNLLFFGVYY